ncbi:PilZ domain-containing protein [Sphingomonas sp. CJ20]
MEAFQNSALAPGAAAQAALPVDRAPRVVTTLLVGKLLGGDRREYLCRIRNISATGMLVESNRLVAIGEPVWVELRSGDRLAGDVAWCEPGRMGVQFDAPIVVDDILANAKSRLAMNEAGVPRAPRFAVQCAARINSFGRSIDVMVENVSQSGAGLRMAKPPHRDTQVILSIPGLPPRRCTTRWSDEERAGLTFLDVIPYHELAAWLGQQAGAD